MNDEARTELDRILALESAALTEADRAFLSARRDYMTEEQRINYGLIESASSSSEESSESEALEAAKTASPYKARKNQVK